MQASGPFGTEAFLPAGERTQRHSCHSPCRRADPTAVAILPAGERTLRQSCHSPFRRADPTAQLPFSLADDRTLLIGRGADPTAQRPFSLAEERILRQRGPSHWQRSGPYGTEALLPGKRGNEIAAASPEKIIGTKNNDIFCHTIKMRLHYEVY